MFTAGQSMENKIAFKFFIKPIFQHFQRLKDRQPEFQDGFCSAPTLVCRYNNQMTEDGFTIDLVFRDENSTQIEDSDNGDDERVKYDYYSKEIIWLSLRYRDTEEGRTLELEKFYVRPCWYQHNQEAMTRHARFSLSDTSCYTAFHFSTVLAGCVKNFVSKFGLAEQEIFFNNVMEDNSLIRRHFGEFSYNDRDVCADGYDSYQGAFKEQDFFSQYKTILSGGSKRVKKRSPSSNQYLERDEDTMDVDKCFENDGPAVKKVCCRR